jgi:hypothetical protein
MSEQILINPELLAAMKKWFIRTIRYEAGKRVFILSAKERKKAKLEIYRKRAHWAGLFASEHAGEPPGATPYKKLFLILDAYFMPVNRLTGFKYWYEQKDCYMRSKMKDEALRELHIRQYGATSEFNKRLCGKICSPCSYCGLNCCDECRAFCSYLECEKSFSAFAAKADK